MYDEPVSRTSAAASTTTSCPVQRMCKAPIVPADAAEPTRPPGSGGRVDPVPSSRSAEDSQPLAVAVDATPLLGRPTGVGAFCAGALSGLARCPDLAVSAFAISWRRRGGIAPLLPRGVVTRQRAMPARPLHRMWARWSVPPVEWFVGGQHVVHGTNFVVPPTRRAARVVTVHDLTVVRYPELCDGPTLAFPDLIRRALATGAWVHTPSAYVAAEVVDLFGVDPARVRAVHHGVPLLAAPGSPPTGATGVVGAGSPVGIGGIGGRGSPGAAGRYILAIGTIEPRKDYPSLVEAFDLVASEDPEVRLVVVGATGWGGAAFTDAIKASPYRSRITHLGYLHDAALADVLREATVLAFPSRYEGFGLPPLQAMAVGVPVVATAVGAIPEVVGDAAVLVPPGDAGALAGALAGVLSGGPSVAELVGRGRRRAAGFTWDACAAGLTDLYRDAWAARTGPVARGGSRARQGSRSTGTGGWHGGTSASGSDSGSCKGAGARGAGSTRDTAQEQR